MIFSTSSSSFSLDVEDGGTGLEDMHGMLVVVLVAVLSRGATDIAKQWLLL